MKEFLLNSAWMMSNLPASSRMLRAFRSPRREQEKLLKHLLSRNCNTNFGRQHNFADIRGVDDFRKYVPLRQYDDFIPWIERIRTGKSNQLTSEPVIQLMPSSGSVAARKLIPYTKTLQNAYDQAIAAWIVNLFRLFPRLRGGKAYWSVTPNIVPDDVEVGFQDDTDYLGGVKRRLVDPLMAVRSVVSGIKEMNTFKYVTLLELVRCGNLRLISVWHPSFLSLLLQSLPEYWEQILRDVNDGTISPPRGIGNGLAAQLERGPDRKRRCELELLDKIDPNQIWPELGLISCWGGGHAQAPMQELKKLFPAVQVQPKGLISTEAIMSFPFRSSNQEDWLHPLAVNSCFMEFLDNSGEPRLAHELDVGEEYNIVVTTAGGFYRYIMNDRVRVNGYVGNTPSIEFLGKTDLISDFYGEKLNDLFVANCLKELLSGVNGRVSFSMLAPDGGEQVRNYTLFLEMEGALPIELDLKLEHMLTENIHYSNCRRLNQLSRARVFGISKNANQVYLDKMQEVGRKLGDIKPVKLSGQNLWYNAFCGRYL